MHESVSGILGCMIQHHAVSDANSWGSIQYHNIHTNLTLDFLLLLEPHHLASEQLTSTSSPQDSKVLRKRRKYCRVDVKINFLLLTKKLIVKIQTEYLIFYPHDHFNHIKVNLIKPTPTTEKTLGEMTRCDMQGEEQSALASSTHQWGYPRFISPHQYSVEDSTRICLIL